MSVLTMAVQALGVPAQGFTGYQAGIITNTRHNKAQISHIKADRIEKSLSEGNVVIVAGFQGYTSTGELTTLGRGGSDTSAVALAAALKADLCEIYSDVDGIYTADPRMVPRAKKLDYISYDEMLELTASGSSVLQMRAVEFARNYKVPLSCRSAFSDEPGTLIKEEAVEQAIVSGIAYDNSEAKITIRSVPDTAGIAAGVFGAIAKANINIDMIVQNVAENGITDISFTAPMGELDRLRPVLEEQIAELGAREYLTNEKVSKLSLVGAGFRTNPGIAAKMFKVLSNNGINIDMISTSAIRVSVIIDVEKIETAIQALHTAFDLDSKQVFQETALSEEELVAKANKGR